MRYRDAAAFRQALERRLNERAGGDGARLARDRKRVAFERLLARLTAVAPDRWLLKGGFAIDLRLADRARSTKDVDIDWHAGDQELADALIDAAAHDAGDFFVLGVERAGAPEDRLGGSHRFRVSATLAGRPFERFPLDVGIRVEPIADAEQLTTPALLAFAGIAPITVRALPLELHAAEKLHAYTRTYLGARASSRVKDLVDLVVIIELGGLRAAALRAAIDETFRRRGTHEPPTALPVPPGDWRTPYRRLAAEVGAPPILEDGHARAAQMLDPVLGAAAKTSRWDAEALGWTAE